VRRLCHHRRPAGRALLLALAAPRDPATFVSRVETADSAADYIGYPDDSDGEAAMVMWLCHGCCQLVGMHLAANWVSALRDLGVQLVDADTPTRDRSTPSGRPVAPGHPGRPADPARATRDRRLVHRPHGRLRAAMTSASGPAAVVAAHAQGRATLPWVPKLSRRQRRALTARLAQPSRARDLAAARP